MRKFITLCLIFSLCLSLCACSVDEQYKPLIDSLEKNDYDGVKSALTAVSAEFASEQDELAKYRKYESLINSLENEDFETALAEFNQILPTPPEPVYITREITLDNWDTYLELFVVEDWQINGFGEAENYSLNYQFKVREEYLTKINRNNFNLSVELSYTANYHNATVNLATQEVNIGKIATNISGDQTGDVSKVCDISSMDENGLLIGDIVATYLIQWDNGTQSMYVIEDMPVVTRIQGSIQLLEE